MSVSSSRKAARGLAVAAGALLAGFIPLAAAPGSAAAQAPGQEAPPHRQVFVSPFGEPFIAEPEEAYPVALWFEGADTDEDGRLTRDEFSADGLRWFAIVDQNGDGVIGPEEVRAYEATIARLFAGVTLPGSPGARGGRAPRGGGGRGGAARLSLAAAGQSAPPSDPVTRNPRRTYQQASTPLAMAGLLNVPQPIKAADTDTNQRITAVEWAAVTERWFSLLDANRDGVLTLAELPETQLQVLAKEPVRGRGRR